MAFGFSPQGLGHLPRHLLYRILAYPLQAIGVHDMGQGAWSALAQIAADALALDIDELEFRSGTSDHPDVGIVGGNYRSRWTA
jgi:hypothetical protein